MIHISNYKHNNSIRKDLILNKIKEIKQYRIKYDKVPAFGNGSIAGTKVTPSITEMEQKQNKLYKLLFDNQDTHTGLIDEIETLIEGITE